MSLTKTQLEKTYNIILEKAQMIRKEDNKEITGWVAKANNSCIFGEDGDIVAFGATLKELDEELSNQPIGFGLIE